MSLKRRRFLILGGLSGLGLTVAGKTLFDRATASSQRVISQPKPVISEVSQSAKDLVLRFVAVADTGAGDRNQYAVAEAMNRHYDRAPYPIVLLAGDNIYTNGEFEKIKDVFEHPYSKLLKQGTQFYAALGNHDIRYQNGDLQVKYPGFRMKGRRYTFREKSVQFFVLETNPSADWKGQVTWLDKELMRSDAPWKVVVGHHPIYSSGVYGTDQGLVSLLTPLFKKHGVQLYINGHEHSYERTQSIDGTTYLITGIGGAHLRPVGRSPWTEYSTSQFGFSSVAVYKDRLEISGIGTDSQIFDQGIVPLKSA
ncbi:metallophosphoesterase family protein [Phormidesmis sp. 146-35]